MSRSDARLTHHLRFVPKRPVLGSQLSNRESQCAALVATGRANKEIAYALGVTVGTLKIYLNRAFKRTGCANRTELALWWLRNSPVATQVSPWLGPLPASGPDFSGGGAC